MQPTEPSDNDNQFGLSGNMSELEKVDILRSLILEERNKYEMLQKTADESVVILTKTYHELLDSVSAKESLIARLDSASRRLLALESALRSAHAENIIISKKLTLCEDRVQFLESTSCDFDCMWVERRGFLWKTLTKQRCNVRLYWRFIEKSLLDSSRDRTSRSPVHRSPLPSNRVACLSILYFSNDTNSRIFATPNKMRTIDVAAIVGIRIVGCEVSIDISKDFERCGPERALFLKALFHQSSIISNNNESIYNQTITIQKNSRNNKKLCTDRNVSNCPEGPIFNIPNMLVPQAGDDPVSIHNLQIGNYDNINNKNDNSIVNNGSSYNPALKSLNMKNVLESSVSPVKEFTSISDTEDKLSTTSAPINKIIPLHLNTELILTDNFEATSKNDEEMPDHYSPVIMDNLIATARKTASETFNLEFSSLSAAKHFTECILSSMKALSDRGNTLLEQQETANYHALTEFLCGISEGAEKEMEMVENVGMGIALAREAAESGKGGAAALEHCLMRVDKSAMHELLESVASQIVKFDEESDEGDMQENNSDIRIHNACINESDRDMHNLNYKTSKVNNKDNLIYIHKSDGLNTDHLNDFDLQKYTYSKNFNYISTSNFDTYDKNLKDTNASYPGSAHFIPLTPSHTKAGDTQTPSVLPSPPLLTLTRFSSLNPNNNNTNFTDNNPVKGSLLEAASRNNRKATNTVKVVKDITTTTATTTTTRKPLKPEIDCSSEIIESSSSSSCCLALPLLKDHDALQTPIIQASSAGGDSLSRAALHLYHNKAFQDTPFDRNTITNYGEAVSTSNNNQNNSLVELDQSANGSIDYFVSNRSLRFPSSPPHITTQPMEVDSCAASKDLIANVESDSLASDNIVGQQLSSCASNQNSVDQQMASRKYGMYLTPSLSPIRSDKERKTLTNASSGAPVVTFDHIVQIKTLKKTRKSKKPLAHVQATDRSSSIKVQNEISEDLGVCATSLSNQYQHVTATHLENFEMDIAEDNVRRNTQVTSVGIDPDETKLVKNVAKSTCLMHFPAPIVRLENVNKDSSS